MADSLGGGLGVHHAVGTGNPNRVVYRDVVDVRLQYRLMLLHPVEFGDGIDRLSWLDDMYVAFAAVVHPHSGGLHHLRTQRQRQTDQQ